MTENNNVPEAVVDTNSLLTWRLPERAGTRPMTIKQDRHLIECIGTDRFEGGRSIMVYCANTTIQQLMDWTLGKGDVRRLNVHGLDIFLWEPICSYRSTEEGEFTEFNMGFYSEIRHDAPDMQLKCAEFDSIAMFVHFNKLTNVKVHTCDYNVERYNAQYPNLDLCCNDVFVKSLNLFDNIHTENKKEIKKKFISTNWRFTTARAIISAILSQRSSHLAWYFQIDVSAFNKSVWFNQSTMLDMDTDFFSEFMTGIDYCNNTGPFWLDHKADKIVEIDDIKAYHYPRTVEDFDKIGNPISSNVFKNPLQKFYDESFVDIVNESRYAQPTANISEKVIQSMQFGTPFIMVSSQYTLKYLKELGFKTFSAWWDESYDDEPDHLKRIGMIYDVINYIDSKSETELYTMYLEMLPVLEHNFKQIFKVITSDGLSELAHVDVNTVKDVQWMPTESEDDIDTIEDPESEE